MEEIIAQIQMELEVAQDNWCQAEENTPAEDYHRGKKDAYEYCLNLLAR